MPICSRARGRALSITTSAAAISRRRSRRPGRGRQVQRHRTLRAVEQVEEGRRAPTGTVGPRRRLHLDHVAPRPRPAAARTEARPTATERSTTERLGDGSAAPVRLVRHAGPRRAGRTPGGPGGPTEPTAAIGRPSSAARSSSAAARRAPRRLRRRSARDRRRGRRGPTRRAAPRRRRAGPGRRPATRRRVRTRRAPPPQLMAPPRARSPRAARSPSRASPSTRHRPSLRRSQHRRRPIDQVDQGGRRTQRRAVGPSGQGHGAAGRPRRAPPIHRSILPPVGTRASAPVSGSVVTSAFSTPPTASWRRSCARPSRPSRSRIRAASWCSPRPTAPPAEAGVVDRLASLPCIVVAVDRAAGRRPRAGRCGARRRRGVGRRHRGAWSERNPVAATALVLCLRQASPSLGPGPGGGVRRLLACCRPGRSSRSGGPPAPFARAGPNRDRRSRWSARATTSSSSSTGPTCATRWTGPSATGCSRGWPSPPPTLP